MSDNTEHPCVLAVDDEPLVLDLIAAALEDGGYAVRTAGTGAEALAILEAHEAQNLDGLVTDIQLGATLTGWTVASRARELSANLPIVYITGDSAHEWSARGVPRSVIILKPFALHQVLAALASLLDHSGL